MERDFSKTKYGSFLVIPLKFQDEPNVQNFEKLFDVHNISTPDLNPNVKALFHNESIPNVGKCYRLRKEKLYRYMDVTDYTLSVHNDGYSYRWAFRDSYLYLFHTKVAFFCLGIEYEEILALQAICNPGFAVNTAKFFCDQEQRQFSLNEMLGEFLKQLQLQQFFDTESILLDYYSYNLALFPERFDTMEEMKKLSFNLHQMIPLDFDMDDHSERDVHYVFAVRDYAHNSYRWGCCVTSQTISYVVADKQMDFDSEWTAQAEDGLPVVILSLYQKYTCLRFNQLLTDTPTKNAKTLKALKRLMLNFKAFGTVAPANLSRWDNVRQIYHYLMDVNGVNQALADIVDKLNILTSHQEAIEQKKNDTILNIITIFGIVSILASVLSIVQILSGADTLLWTVTVLTSLILMGAIIIVFRFKD